jgi:hypothetical protein
MTLGESLESYKNICIFSFLSFRIVKSVEGSNVPTTSQGKRAKVQKDPGKSSLGANRSKRFKLLIFRCVTQYV